MNIVFLILFVITTFSVIGQTTNNNLVEVVLRKPFTPLQDSLIIWSKTNGSKISRVPKTDSILYDQYYLNKKLFNGWAYFVFPESNHKYRYSKYENGQLVWQITYFDNGRISSDFHLKKGESGSERMWHPDGSLYVDLYHNEFGKDHGIQWRWYANGVLARKALFENGKLVYELLFDKNGVLTGKKGEEPEEK